MAEIQEKTSLQTKIVTPQELEQQAHYAQQVLAWNRAFETKTGHKRRVQVITFGCQQNEADAERLLGMAQSMGYDQTTESDQADLILINTCAVRQHAELRALSITGQYKHLKAKNPDLLIGICGCMVSQQTRSDEIKMKYPYVNFSFGTEYLYRLPEILHTALTTQKRRFYLNTGCGNLAEGLPVERHSRISAWVSIMYGCNNFCSYCVVPYVRGRERSRAAEDIVQEVRGLVEVGYREITLLGQNVNSYGKDRAGSPDFPTLLEMLCAIEGDFTLRFMTSHPKDASDKLLNVMAREPKIARQFHLPLQSGSDRVLAAMNRKYTAESYLSLLKRMRTLMPDITVSSDMIVGYPTETEEDFAQTLEVLREAEFDMIFSFIFSPRPGTPAAKLPQLPDEVTHARFSRLLEVQNEISLRKNRAWIGKTCRVLVTGESKNDARFDSARTDGGKLVLLPACKEKRGTFCTVCITDADTFSLRARYTT